MDSSDITAKRKQQAVYVSIKTAYATNNGSSNCPAVSTCTTVGTCDIKFPSYDIKNAFYAGKNVCTGCECPITNGSR